RAPRIVRETLAYTIIGTAAFGVLGMVVVLISGWDEIGVASLPIALLGFLNIAPVAAVLGHLGGVTSGGAVVDQVNSETVTVIGAGEPLPWMLVLAALLVSLYASLWIGTRRPRTAGLEWKTTWQLPVAVLAG